MGHDEQDWTKADNLVDCRNRFTFQRVHFAKGARRRW
jgi:hypothetical protein